jgi:hypothetical protein
MPGIDDAYATLRAVALAACLPAFAWALEPVVAHRRQLKPAVAGAFAVFILVSRGTEAAPAALPATLGLGAFLRWRPSVRGWIGLGAFALAALVGPDLPRWIAELAEGGAPWRAHGFVGDLYTYDQSVRRRWTEWLDSYTGGFLREALPLGLLLFVAILHGIRRPRVRGLALAAWAALLAALSLWSAAPETFARSRLLVADAAIALWLGALLAEGVDAWRRA